MPRTETCGNCDGAGYVNDLIDGDEICPHCKGNGYTAAPVTFENMTFDEASGLVIEGPAPADLDFALGEPPAPVNRMANATWRILEEQRTTALETVAEIDAQVEALLAKRNDALKAAAMCEAGQKGVS